VDGVRWIFCIAAVSRCWMSLGVAAGTRIAAKVEAWGFDGVELACWGDHFEVDRAMPKTAIARLALEEILLDGGGRPLRTTGGQLRRKKVAVLYHDEATASLWLSAPGVAVETVTSSIASRRGLIQRFK